MSSVWEKTLVVAFRDMQWLHHVNSGGLGVPPNIFSVFDGPAESIAGDLLTSQSRRFYLFELKASDSRIPSEWRGDKGPKVVFTRLKHMVGRVKKADKDGDSPSDVDAQILNLSLRGHHIAYFSSDGGSGVSEGRLWIEPYLMATVKRSQMDSLGMPQLPLIYSLTKESAIGSQRHFRLTYGDCVLTPAYVTSHYDEDGKEIPVGMMGLPLLDMSIYLDFLAEKFEAGDEEVKAVVVDNDGNFYGVVESLHNLRDLISMFRNPAARFARLKV